MQPAVIAEIVDTFSLIILRAVLVVGFVCGLGVTLVVLLIVALVRWHRRRQPQPQPATQHTEMVEYEEVS